VRENVTAAGQTAIKGVGRVITLAAPDGVRTAAEQEKRKTTIAEHASERAAWWDPGLARILSGRALYVAFQPILKRRHIGDGWLRWEIVGAEALVSARGEGTSTLRPDKLLPLVERAGLMHRLFVTVLTTALAAARRWERDAGVRLEVSVNLHAAALLDDALPAHVLGLLEAADFAPARLTLELTESAPIADLHRAAENVRALRRHGLRVSLDDFGVGFSTTTRLDWLECDELKIDRSLVFGLEHCDEQRRLVETLILLAHTRGMCACAEGIETMPALQLLGALGCDRAQGYLIGRPGPAAAMPAFVQDWRDRSDEWFSPDAAQLPLPGLMSEFDVGNGSASPARSHASV
jgi:EAL domain-containing protein (putative c-di-GMP-specific phosphodiesterase class I)